jgi:hypothetical protein
MRAYREGPCARCLLERRSPANHDPATSVTDPIRGADSPCHLGAGQVAALGWLDARASATTSHQHQLHAGALTWTAYWVLSSASTPILSRGDVYERSRTGSTDAWPLMYLRRNGLNCEVEFLDDATLRFKTQPGRQRRPAGHAGP